MPLCQIWTRVKRSKSKARGRQKHGSDRQGESDVREEPERHSPCGEVVVKAVPMIADYIVPLMGGLENLCSDLSLRFVSSPELDQIMAGTPTLHIRAGAEPVGDDLYVKALGKVHFGLYAAPNYIASRGMPKDIPDLARYSYVVHDRAWNRVPWEKWLVTHVPDAHIFLYSDCENAHRVAISSGHCLGFLPSSALIHFPNLVEVLPPHPEWSAAMWLVTHADTMRSDHLADITRSIGDRLARVWG